MKKTFAFLLVLLSGLALTAQNIPYYSFQKSTEPYQALDNSVSVNNGLQWDDPNILIPTNMEFVVFGQTFNTLYLGVMGAGFSNVDEENEDIEDLPFYVTLTPFFTDLMDRCLEYEDFKGDGDKRDGLKRFRQEGDTGSCSNLSYRIDGTPGSRIFKFEWQNASIYDAVDSNYLNMQMWYYENGHVIEFRYGPSYISGNDYGMLMTYDILTPVIHMENLATEVSYMAILSGDPDNPTHFCGSTLDSLTYDIEMDGLSRQPYPNTVYRFEPGTVGVSMYELPGVSVFPNPVSDQLCIYGTEHAVVEIFNVAGQLLSVHSYSGPIDMSDLSGGIYFVKVSENGRHTVKKVLKVESR